MKGSENVCRCDGGRDIFAEVDGRRLAYSDIDRSPQDFKDGTNITGLGSDLF